jgi:NADH:ubiquinone oxidoreductase subunit 3 (subunit A)
MPELVGYLLLFIAVGAGFILVHLLIGKLIRPARPYDDKLTIYECGEPTIGSAWVQFDVRYYVIALLFVIFDVEVAFFFPWAVVYGKLTELAKPNLPNQERVAALVGSGDPPAGYSKVSDVDAPKMTFKLAGDDTTYKFDEKTTNYNRVIPGAFVKLTLKDNSKTDVTAVEGKPLGQTLVPPYPENKGDRETLQKALKEDPMSDSAKTMLDDTRQAASQMMLIAFLDIAVFFGVLLVGFAYLWKRGDLNWVRSVAAEEGAPAAEQQAAAPSSRDELVAGHSS